MPILTSKRENLAPAPEVQHLPTLFRRIENGEIRIPAFQRRFVWTESQVIKLLESVYRGYPIGSVLLWRVDSPVLQVSQDPTIPFPSTEAKYPLSFVLDGMQRLSTLYGVVYWERATEAHVFNVIFDLERQAFLHYAESELPRAYLPLSVLSSPRRLLEAQKYLADLPSADQLIDRSIELQARFQEYLVPTVSIGRRDVTEVVEIFERINSTGTKLSTFDFMRALTWSDAFDLNERISQLRAHSVRRGYDWRPETLVKIVAVVLGVPPVPQDMLHLRLRSASELNRGVERSREVISELVTLLRRRFHILSADYVPYEGQILVLSRALAHRGRLSPAIMKELERWFWAISFSEGLRGKPDHYVARFLNNVDDLIAGEVGGMEYRLDITPEQFLERRFITGAALSAAVVSMLARNHARSLTTGEVIPPEWYAAEFGAENFAALFSVSEVRAVLGRNVPSARVFANMVVVSEEERAVFSSRTPVEIIQSLYANFGRRTSMILESQFLPPDSLELLENDNVNEFLANRADLLFLAANDLAQ